MGLLDKLKASAIEAGKIAKKYTNEAIEYSEKNYGKEEWYQNAKEAVEKTKAFANEARQVGNEMISEFSNSELGRQVGNKARDFTSILSQLPVISITSDFIKNKNGINELYQLVKNEPYAAEKYIWLAEAMNRVKKDSKMYSTFRTVIHPTSIIYRETIKTAASMGLEKGDKYENRVLKNAYYLSINKLKERKDAKHLHILARVYLLTGDNLESIKFCKMAIIADPNYKLPYITLARAYLCIGQYQNSKKAAEIAISNNLLYAYDILAQLVMLEESEDVPNKIERYSFLRDKVRKEDRKAYLGWAVDEVSIVETIGREQMNKLDHVISKTKEYYNKSKYQDNRYNYTVKFEDMDKDMH